MIDFSQIACAGFPDHLVDGCSVFPGNPPNLPFNLRFQAANGYLLHGAPPGSLCLTICRTQGRVNFGRNSRVNSGSGSTTRCGCCSTASRIFSTPTDPVPIVQKKPCRSDRQGFFLWGCDSFALRRACPRPCGWPRWGEKRGKTGTVPSFPISSGWSRK